MREGWPIMRQVPLASLRSRARIVNRNAPFALSRPLGRSQIPKCEKRGLGRLLGDVRQESTLIAHRKLFSYGADRAHPYARNETRQGREVQMNTRELEHSAPVDSRVIGRLIFLIATQFTLI